MPLYENAPKPHMKRRHNTVPIVAGGVYRRKNTLGGVDYATMLAVSVDQAGKSTGHLHQGTRASIMVREGMEEFSRWELVAEPVLMDQPVMPTTDTEGDVDPEEMKATLSRLTERLEAQTAERDQELQRASVASYVDALRTVDPEMAWSDVTDKVNARFGQELPWQTVKAIWRAFFEKD